MSSMAIMILTHLLAGIVGLTVGIFATLFTITQFELQGEDAKELLPRPPKGRGN